MFLDGSYLDKILNMSGRSAGHAAIYYIYRAMTMKRSCKGLRVAEVLQVDENHCDDVNVVSEDPDNIIVIDFFNSFENSSGAILSRSKKAKVIGLGKRRNRRFGPSPG